MCVGECRVMVSVLGCWARALKFIILITVLNKCIFPYGFDCSGFFRVEVFPPWFPYFLF